MGLIKCVCKKTAMDFKHLTEKDMPNGYEAECCAKAEPAQAPEASKAPESVQEEAPSAEVAPAAEPEAAPEVAPAPQPEAPLTRAQKREAARKNAATQA